MIGSRTEFADMKYKGSVLGEAEVVLVPEFVYLYARADH